MKSSILYPLCRIYRRACLSRTTFIGVTGSCGKTTTKDLIAAILSSQYPGKWNSGTSNTPYHVVRTILRTSPFDRFCIQELAAAYRDRIPLDVPIGLMKPEIGVVTNIHMDHFDVFGSIEAIAAEKSKLIRMLPPNGTALLNADDPRVLAMRDNCAASVFTYGLSANSALRADDIKTDWPRRLSFTAIHESGRVRIETQLCGAHWVPNVLASLAVGMAMGIPLSVAAKAIRCVPPADGRMSPVTGSDGVTFIRDDWKAPYTTIPASLEFMRSAKATRKIVVMGTISDYQGESAPKYVEVAKRALEVADVVLFVGRWASRCLRARRHSNDQSLRAFSNVDGVCEFLRGHLRPGDLILIKGSAAADHLDRIVSSWEESQRNARSQNHNQSQAESKNVEAGADKKVGTRTLSAKGNTLVQVVIGLGNPGQKYRDTPHNVGQQTLDHLAASLDVTWERHGDAVLASTKCNDRDVLLVKPLTPVNDTGPMLLRLSERRGFGPENCIVVHDDIDLPIGRVRQRMRGSGGGHNGVLSIIHAFQSEGVRRVKIGVGRPLSGESIARHVLKPFSAEQLPVIEEALAEAAARIVALIKSRPNPQS